jgi:hypothetical protein
MKQPKRFYLCKEIDACLFALDAPTGFVYHTIQHPGLDAQYSGDFTWNLPLPYRPITRAEHFCLENWIRQLQGQPDLELPETYARLDEWTKMQMLLYCLRIGHTYLSAEARVTHFVAEMERDRGIINYLEAFRHRIEGAAAFGSTALRPLSVRPVFKLRGDDVIQAYSSWEEGEQYLREYLEKRRRH